jgi:CheY-like chemotaxis protein/anti-sigma regulatory factor (Ser/Thr protein kinase)
LNQVAIAGQRATEQVKQILTFSRKTKYRMTTVKIQKVITEALKLLRPSIPTTIEIRQNIDQRCPPILADAIQIHQVIMNLCTNAYHAMREQKTGVLEISLNKTDIQPATAIPQLNLQNGRYLRLSISDTGTGMDDSTLKKIFDPYFTTKKQGEGTGLGLAIAHGIIRDFGGHISVYSELGKGTCFKIYLPIPPVTGKTTQEVTTPIEVPMGTEHLLIVDDEKPIVYLIKVMLERYGYQVTSTSESPEALRAFKQFPELFDMVITDYAMPKMNGIDLAKELLKIRPDLPILLCTGFNDSENQTKALQSGIKACINKPIQADQLALLVRKTLDSD